jgi:hypothetical protein
MRKNLVALSISLCTALACAPGGADSEPSAPASPSAHDQEAPQRSTLALVRSGGEGKSHELALKYVRGEGASGPRVVELFVRLSKNLTYDDAEPGGAADRAGKDVVVQDKGDGLLRVLAYSSASLSELDTGDLVSLTVHKTGELPASAEILTDNPMFAPQAASDGLLVAEPLSL